MPELSLPTHRTSSLVPRRHCTVAAVPPPPQYVADVQNLKLMMDLLKDPSRSIQFEAFHVFKVFVANPNKTWPVVATLHNNKDKLLRYLEDFHTDRGACVGVWVGGVCVWGVRVGCACGVWGCVWMCV